MNPSDHVSLNRRKVNDPTLFDRDEVCAFGTTFTNVPSLQITTKYDVRIFVENGLLVHVRERPIVVSFIYKIIEAARSVVGVAAEAPETGVEHADIK